MAADNFVALVNAHSRGRSVLKIAEDAGLAPHTIQRYMRPSFVLRKMPTPERVNEIARALDAPAWDVSRAFGADLVREATPEVVVSRQEVELTTLFRRLSPPYQETLLQMARSLSHLEHAVSQPATPELGDGHAAV